MQRQTAAAALGSFDGEPSFQESGDVSVLFEGGSNEATAAHVMEGTAADRAKIDALETPEMLDQLRTARPDLIGGLRGWFDGGAFTEVAYFTSEEEARKGESSAAFSGPQDEYMALFGDMTFHRPSRTAARLTVPAARNHPGAR